jgi:hypothetical protein
VITKQHAATAAVLSYEVIAITSSGRLPTITALCERHHWLGVVVVGALIVHLALSRPVIVVITPPAP